MRKRAKVPQLLLFDQSGAPATDAVDKTTWPAPDRFPLNVHGVQTVGAQVLADLRRASTPLLVVGYSALDHLIDLVADTLTGSTETRLLFGSEPFPSKREKFELSISNFPDEAQSYWLSHGISLRLSGKVIRAQELLRAGRVKARYLGNSRIRLHAKMYCGDDAITLGSSNFTDPGLKYQMEANARFTADDGARYAEARQVAENFWQLGQDYTDKLIELLDALLRVVNWEEALARGCAELLEGE